MPYVHIETALLQRSKRPGAPCGDVFAVDRSAAGTTLVLCDGVGSGVRAHLAARLAASRLMERVRSGASLQRAFTGLLRTLEANRGTERPWATCLLGRVLPEGDATFLVYESPAPILVSRRHAQVLAPRPVSESNLLFGEIHCHLRPGDALLLLSDGVTQAGLGRRLPGMAQGWGIEGVCREANLLLADGVSADALPARLEARAQELAQTVADDSTIALARCCRGVTASVLTGPPANREHDDEVVRRFLADRDVHIVCGATTASVVARAMRREVVIDAETRSSLAPPPYRIEGIDLVTEGAVTLNHLYNVLDARPEELEPGSPVTRLYHYLMTADRVRILLGAAPNPAGDSIAFRQKGILLRDKIVPLIAEKLRQLGKLVEVHPC